MRADLADILLDRPKCDRVKYLTIRLHKFTCSAQFTIKFRSARGKYLCAKLIAKLGTITELSKAAELFGQQEQIKYTDDYEILDRAFI